MCWKHSAVPGTSPPHLWLSYIFSECVCATKVPDLGEEELKVKQRNAHVFRETRVGNERCCGRNSTDPLCRWSPRAEPCVAGWWSEEKRWWIRFNTELGVLPHSVRWICDIKCIYCCAMWAPAVTSLSRLDHRRGLAFYLARFDGN